MFYRSIIFYFLIIYTSFSCFSDNFFLNNKSNIPSNGVEIFDLLIRERNFVFNNEIVNEYINGADDLIFYEEIDESKKYNFAIFSSKLKIIFTNINGDFQEYDLTERELIEISNIKCFNNTIIFEKTSENLKKLQIVYYKNKKEISYHVQFGTDNLFLKKNRLEQVDKNNCRCVSSIMFSNKIGIYGETKSSSHEEYNQVMNFNHEQ